MGNRGGKRATLPPCIRGTGRKCKRKSELHLLPDHCSTLKVRAAMQDLTCLPQKPLQSNELSYRGTEAHTL